MKRTAIKVEDTDSFPNGFLVWNVGIIVIIIVIDNEFIFLTLLPVLFLQNCGISGIFPIVVSNFRFMVNSR